MEIDVMIRNRFLEFRISSIALWLPAIPYMIEVTVFYSFLVGVKKPPIHESNPKMVGMRLLRIEGGKVLTRDSNIDEYRSSKRNSIHGSDIDSKPIFGDGEIFLTPLGQKPFMGIWNFGFFIDFEILTKVIDEFDREFSRHLKLEYFPPMSSSTGWPLLPVVWGIEHGEGAPRWMKEFKILDNELGYWNPSFRSIHDSHWSPEYNSMVDPYRPEQFRSWLNIDLLCDHRISISENTTCSEKSMSIINSMKQESWILLIVVMKHLRSCTIIGKISWNVRSKKCFPELLEVFLRKWFECSTDSIEIDKSVNARYMSTTLVLPESPWWNIRIGKNIANPDRISIEFPSQICFSKFIRHIKYWLPSLICFKMLEQYMQSLLEPFTIWSHARIASEFEIEGKRKIETFPW